MSVQRTKVDGKSTDKRQQTASNRFGKFAIEIEIHPNYIDRDINKNPDGTDKPGRDVPLVPLSDNDRSRTIINRRKQKPDLYRPSRTPEIQLPIYHEDRVPEWKDIPAPLPHKKPSRGVTYLD